MGDEEAMRRAILADPWDDTVRLAYADWLDEHDRVSCPRCDGRGQVFVQHLPDRVYKIETGPVPDHLLKTPVALELCPECRGLKIDIRAGRAAFIRHTADNWPFTHRLKAEVEAALPPGTRLSSFGRSGMDAGPRYGRPYWVFQLVDGSGFSGRLFFDRGFVGEVEAPLAVLNSPDFMGRLLSHQPVTEVRPTDRHPWKGTFDRPRDPVWWLHGRGYWLWEAAEADRRSAAMVPWEVLRYMPHGVEPFGTYRQYLSEADAYKALSHALLWRGRHAAGLPGPAPITFYVEERKAALAQGRGIGGPTGDER